MEIALIKSIFLVLHIVAGGVSLITGGLALTFIKGSIRHVKTGRIYFYTMLTVAITAFVLSVIDAHLFLLLIGIFTLYLTLSGYRGMRKKITSLDWSISISMVGAALVMGIMGAKELLNGASFGYVLLLFAGLGLLLSRRDILLYRKEKLITAERKSKHLSGMIGAYIATWTAFIVVNFDFGLAGWIGPSALGTALIIYWSIKVEAKKTKISSQP